MNVIDSPVIPKGRAVELGNITTADLDGKTYEHRFAMLLVFESADDLRAAIAQKACALGV